jgi:Fe-S cluster assembly protein SufD
MSVLIDNKELFSSILAAASRHIEEIFADTRQQALTALSGLGLPDRKSEEYRFTPITRSLEKLFTTWPAMPLESRRTDIQPFLIDGLECSVLVLTNGNYISQLSVIRDSDILVQDLRTSPSSQISEVLFKQADFSKDAFVALNTAAWSGGVSIQVPDGTSVKKPLLILNIVDSISAPAAPHSRLAVLLGKNSSLALINRTICLGEESSFATFVEEILVGESARLDYCRLQDQKNETSFTQTSIRQLNDSHVNTFTLTLDGKMVRNNLNIAIDGEHTESHFHGLYLLDGDTLADNHTVVDHRKPNSVSNEMYKGVMDGNSKGVFNGKIYVRPHAQKTNAFQSNRNILLSDKATINTKPQLEIWADDVKCSHGCTTGQLDEEAMFYLRSRGIPKDQARAMLLNAFVAETYSFIENEALRSYIASRVSQRLSR